VGYCRSPHLFVVLMLSLWAALAVGMVIAAGQGYLDIAMKDVLQAVLLRLQGEGGAPTATAGVVPFVVVDVRLPRVLVAALVGGGLAASGVVYQGVLRNPLADPYTLGVSSGAAFGASLALLLAITSRHGFSVPLFAFAGAVATLLAVLRLSNFNGRISPNTLILSGVIVGAILSAGISFIKYLADEQVAVIIFWLMGSFASRSWPQVGVLAASLLLALVVMLLYARELNLLSLGEKGAATLGVETVRVRLVLLVAASFLAAVCVSVSGIIGFVGLIVPHLVRFLVGPDHRRLLLASVPAGALLLLAADTANRAFLPSELPIGVLTALIGGPVFCVIFRRRQQGLRYG